MSNLHKVPRRCHNSNSMKILESLYSTLIVLSIGCGQSQKVEKTPTEENLSIATDTSTQFKSSPQPPQNLETTLALKVYVDNLGNISANGQSVTLSALDSKLKTLKNKNGMVYYSRDHAAGEPPQQSMQVMDLVANYGLSIKFFTDKTFTQAVKIN